MQTTSVNEVEEEIIERVGEDSETNIRLNSRELGVSKYVVSSHFFNRRPDDTVRKHIKTSLRTPSLTKPYV